MIIKEKGPLKNSRESVFVCIEHHRSGLYRHSRHPLSSIEPPSERRKSSRQTLQPPAGGASATFYTPSLTSVTESDVRGLFLFKCTYEVDRKTQLCCSVLDGGLSPSKS